MPREATATADKEAVAVDRIRVNGRDRFGIYCIFSAVNMNQQQHLLALTDQL